MLTLPNREAIRRRARAWIGRGVRYRMGGGLLDPGPTSPPMGPDGTCDCSCFVGWATGIGKYHPSLGFLVALNGGWYNTDGIWVDAHLAVGHYDPVDRPGVGDVIVVPPRRRVGAGPKIGHTGIVGTVKGSRVETVIHCSSGNDRATGDAIQETDAAWFYRWPSVVVCRAATIEGHAIEPVEFCPA